MKQIEIVGIVNVTPDSFSDGGRYQKPNNAVEQVHTLFAQGASYVDIGAESTRPGAMPISAGEEWQRLEPVLQEVVPAYPGYIMLDSYKPETIRRVAKEIGPVIINDVTGMNNPEMVKTAAELRFRCVVSHHPIVSGNDIQKAHETKPVDSIEQVVEELYNRIEALQNAGLSRDLIIIDPGFGFGKSPTINDELLKLPLYMNDLNYFMLGVSRKRSLRQKDFIGEQLAPFETMSEKETEDWLDKRSASVASTGIKNGFNFLRVHNVPAHIDALKNY